MKNYTTLYILLLFFAVSCSSNKTDQHTNKSNKYVEESFTTRYPEDWSVQKNGNSTAFISPKENDDDMFRENIAIKNLNMDVTPTVAVNSLIKNIKKDYVNTTINQHPITVNNLNAIEIAYSDIKQISEQQSFSFDAREILINDKGQTFLITYVGQQDKFATYKADYNLILDHLEVKGK